MASVVLKKLNLLLQLMLLILICATTFGDKWLENYTDHVGLWQVCRQLKCSWMQWTPSYTIAFLDWWSCVRAFMVLSMMATFFAAMFQFLNIKYPLHCHASVVRTCAIFNTMFLMIAVVVFVSKKSEVYDSDWSLGWSFVIACFCWCLSFALSFFICLCIKDEKRDRSARRDHVINIQPVRRPQSPVVVPVASVPGPLAPAPLDEKKVVELGGSEEKLIDVPMSELQPSGSDGRSEKSGRESGAKSSSSRRSASKSETGRSASRSRSRRRGASASKSSARSSFISTGKEDYTTQSETETDATKTDYDDDEGSSYSGSETGSYTSDGSGSRSSSYSESASSVVNTEFL